MRQLAWKRGSYIFSLIGKIVMPVAIVLCFASACSAQVTYDGNQNLPPFGSFSGSDFDIVSLQNGNLHLHIPVGTWQQRGGKTISITFVYDSAAFLRTTTVETVSGHRLQIMNVKSNGNRTGGLFLQSTAGSWSVSSAIDKCLSPSTHTQINLYDNWNITDPEGTKHPVAISVAPGDCGGNILNGPATDGSGMVVNLGSTPPVLLLKDGTRIVLQGSVFNYGGSSWEDPNGNLMGTTDTMGRTLVTVTQGPTTTLTTPLGNKTTAAAYNLYTVLDSNGNAQTYRLDYAAIDVLTNFCPIAGPPGFSCSDFSATRVVPVKLTLPTGLFYQFSWINSSPQELQSITLPTGGSVSYTYSSGCAQGPVPNSQSATTAPDDCLGAVITRTVTANGTSNQWTYAGGKVTDPMGNDQVHVFSEITIGSVSSPNTVETQVSYYQGSASTGKLLKQVITGYTGEAYLGFLVNLRPISTTTILDNGLESQVQTDYETFSANNATFTRLNPTETREYDYGSGAPGPLLRKTDYTYLHTGNQTYQNLNIVDRVTGITVHNGSGTQMAQTTKEYDNYTQGIQAPPGSPVQHDSSFGASNTARGNLTATSHWLNTTNTSLTTRNQYNDLGEVVSTTDPLGHTSQFGYGDSWSNTKCAPASGSGDIYLTSMTNALNQTSSFAYDSCTGALASSTDVNSRTTTHTYDLLSRPVTTSYPDGGSTTNCYTDNPSGTCFSNSLPLKVITTKAITSSSNLATTTVYDGLGRVSQTQLTSDPSGTDLTNTTYDAVGRVASVTNPYRTTSDATYGVTSTTYDVLNRPTQVTHPDGSKIATAYTGRATEVTDEGNGTKSVQRISQVDGLGRMTSVCEVSSAAQLGTTPTPAACGQDIGATGFLTSYSYDTLDDLISVSQGGLNSRTFAYDSLSRLTSATNPESGLTSYTYDADDNMITRTQPAPNQTSASETVTTSYTYDALNRMTGKQYSDDTDNVEYNYDQTSPFGFPLTNQIGRLTTEFDLHTGSVFSYDPMGRVVQNHQCTPQNCGTADFPIAYTYDLIGDILTSTDGQVNTYTRTYNAAAQLTSLVSSFSDANHPGTLFSGAVYNAPGEMTSGKLGNGITETRAYNPRLEMTSSKAGSVYSLSLGYAPNGDVTSATDSVNGAWTYTYDDFNRIATASKSGSAFTYAYDRFGNRWNQELSGSCTAGTAVCLTFDANNHINNGIEAYDAAGNLMTDGFHNYFYDAEHHLIQLDGSDGWCASGTGTAATACYTYDAEGRRVRRTVGSGITDDYLYDLSGHFITQVSGSGTWIRGEIYAGGTHIATYENDLTTPTTFFTHADHLGTERVETAVNGTKCETTTSLPFGDGMNEAGSCDPTALRFTGKMRDSESNLDNFGARYNSSSLGRFMSPDWAAKPVSVPYAQFGDPQSLNLYSYVGNNPISHDDVDGHCWPFCGIIVQATIWLSAESSTPTASPAPASTLTQDQENQIKQTTNLFINLVTAGTAVMAEGAGASEDSAGSEIGETTAGEGAAVVGSTAAEADTVPDANIVVRGGTGEIPSSGTYSGAHGTTLEDAASGVPHGTIRASTAGDIRDAGGSVKSSPEPAYPGGPVNDKHVNITGGQKTFSEPRPNPVDRSQRIPSTPKPKKPTGT